MVQIRTGWPYGLPHACRNQQWCDPKCTSTCFVHMMQPRTWYLLLHATTAHAGYVQHIYVKRILNFLRSSKDRSQDNKRHRKLPSNWESNLSALTGSYVPHQWIVIQLIVLQIPGNKTNGNLASMVSMLYQDVHALSGTAFTRIWQACTIWP